MSFQALRAVTRRGAINNLLIYCIKFNFFRLRTRGKKLNKTNKTLSPQRFSEPRRQWRNGPWRVAVYASVPDGLLMGS